jgi:GxxExxY protein
MIQREIEDIFKRTLDCAFAVHSELGPGLLEHVYETCLYHELFIAGLSVERQKTLPLNYKGYNLETGYRIDLWVERKIIVEVKAVNDIHDIHIAQTLTYMKLSKSKLGLLVNFNVPHLRSGIKRLIL